MPRRASLLLVLAALAGAGCPGKVRSLLLDPPLVRALPDTARDVKTWSWQEEGPLAQDFSLKLRAGITEEQFRSYVDEMGMTPHTPDREYQHGFQPGWGPDPEIEWWTPSTEIGETYVREDGASWSYAKYEDGCIWVVSTGI
jgi:hypothetical protein